MKKILLALATVAMVFASCNKGLEDRLTKLENRVSDIEAFVTNLNAEVEGLQIIVSNLQKNVYVTGYADIKNTSGAVIGYEITFNEGNPIKIYHGNTGETGAKGDAGATPTIDYYDENPDDEVDGEWYWKSGDDWIRDHDNNMIPVYKNVEFSVVEGVLFVAVGNADPISLGSIKVEQGDSMFEGVTVDEQKGTVTINLKGTDKDLVLPFNAAAADEFSLELHLPDPAAAIMGGKLHIGYTLTGCAAESAAIFVQAPKDWAVELDEAAKIISLTVGQTAGRVVVYAINNETGDVKARFVNYNPEELFVVDVANKNYYFSPKGETIEVTVSTGINYDYHASEWLSVSTSEVTKALNHNKFTITVPENTSGRTLEGELTLLAKEGGRELFSMSFVQRSYIPALLADDEGNVVEWEETFTLKVGTTETKKKNAVTFELSDDFSKATYKIKNMFVADSWFNNGQTMSGVGAEYYADLEDGTLTIYKAEHPSYHFGGNVTLKVDLSEMTITSSANINCTTAGALQKAAEIIDYKLAIPAPSQGGESLLAGTWKESFTQGGKQWTNDSVSIEVGADGTVTISNMFRFGEYTKYSGTYTGTVSEDGRVISLPNEKHGPTTHGMLGPISACTLTLSDDNQSLIISAAPNGVTNYTLTR